jgi:hypothetical protein
MGHDRHACGLLLSLGGMLSGGKLICLNLTIEKPCGLRVHRKRNKS